ncbi:unnamed protein product [Rotaria sp. Silwood1]|nr:unnamed protein product [Rotaria sp. Silwood1]CAF3860483.1 unnamed protein product [Rotaria sp. Silwood1]CAF5020411.1 unnamed protein product [Rotaria sp. Silwood1]
MRPDTYEVPFPMLLNRAFEILLGFRNTRTYNGIQIKNLQRILVIKCLNTCDSEEWTQHLLNLTNQAKDFIKIMLIKPTDDETFRLDNILGKIADEDVRVYVVVFKEVSFAIDLNSLYTKRILIGKS